MPTLHLLGTGSAVADPHRTTTMLALRDGDATFVIDCGGDVIQRLLAAGLNPDTICGLFITHEHPDHVAGFPLFMEKIFMLGRKRVLPIYGLEIALDQARRCLATFDTSRWTLPPIEYHVIPATEQAAVLDDDHWQISASPGIHSVPVLGLRIKSKTSGQVVTYSCDTEPSPVITRLAKNADLLIHEATGAMAGHSTPAQAAEVAHQAAAKRLILNHLPAGIRESDLAEARRIFKQTELAVELGTYTF